MILTPITQHAANALLSCVMCTHVHMEVEVGPHALYNVPHDDPAGGEGVKRGGGGGPCKGGLQG